MKRVSHLIFFLSLFLATLTCRGADLPNILVLISDDLGRLDTSVYGSPDARTPTLDLLASQGMTFDNAYVASPSCCPNRASLLTGLMPARHGAHPNHSQMKPGTKEITGVLKAMGYQIASFGKIAHTRRAFEGCDFLYKDPQNMSRDLQALIDSGKLEDKPVCLFVGDRRPHVPWIKDMIYDPEKVTLPLFFVDTKETREHWARYLSDITRHRWHHHHVNTLHPTPALLLQIHKGPLPGQQVNRCRIAAGIHAVTDFWIDCFGPLGQLLIEEGRKLSQNSGAAEINFKGVPSFGAGRIGYLGGLEPLTVYQRKRG